MEVDTERTCVRCGVDISSKRIDAIYCSHSCRVQTTKKRNRIQNGYFVQEQRLCVECSSEFLAIFARNIYCSDRCCRRSYERSKKIDRLVQCSVCESEFTPNSSMHKLCSDACLVVQRKRRLLLRKYGLSFQKFDALLSSQKGQCAICKDTIGDRWAIDHDHSCCPTQFTCGECIRGILCMSCNVGLGLFKDSPEKLANAIQYLTHSNEPGQEGSRYGIIHMDLTD